MYIFQHQIFVAFLALVALFTVSPSSSSATLSSDSALDRDTSLSSATTASSSSLELEAGGQIYACQYFLSAARGSDGNATSGSSYQEPFRTLQHALQQIIQKGNAKANDPEVVVCVEAGRYNLTNPTLGLEVEEDLQRQDSLSPDENRENKEHSVQRYI